MLTVQQTIIINYWKQAMANSMLHNAYLIVGSGVDSKKELVHEFLNEVGLSAKNHPDVVSLGTEVDEDGTSTKKKISVDDVRSLKSRFSGYAIQENGWRVALVESVEDLSIGAANALLKILEEPGTRLVFFLFANNDETLLSTMRSRCHTLYLNNSLETDIFIAEPEEASRCINFIDSNESARWAMLEQMFKKENKLSQVEFEHVVDVWQQVVRKKWKHVLINDKSRARSLQKLLEGLQDVKASLKINVNARLLFERLIVNSV
jgi:DNA polymerase III delta prime subunit